MSGQVRAGYKLTEAGVIPEDWEVKMLKQISPIQSVGLVINPSSYYDDAGTVPMLVGSNVSENAIDWASSKRISELSNAKVGATRVFTGDLVTVRVGEPGVTAVIPPEIDGCNCASMMIVRRHYSFDSTWLCCLMNSKYGRMQVENVQYGTAQKQFNISDAVCFSYPVPPLVEQRAIAAALSDMDTLIRGLDQLIAKKRDIKQAAMQQLLTGQQRLPGFSGEWEVKRLDDIAAIDPESLTGSTSPDYEFNYISLEDVDTGRLQGCTEIKFSNAPSRARRKLRANDILVSTVRPNLMSHLLFSESGNNWIGSTGFSVIRCANGIASPEFIFFHLFGFTINSQIEKIITGSNYPAINSSDVRALEILIPSYSEQIAIAAILSDMDNELATLETRAGKARQLKQGMMQELLTGKIRISERCDNGN